MNFHLPRNLYSLASFTLIYMIASGIIAFISGNSEFVLYLTLLVVLSAIILIVHERVHFPQILLWGLSLWGLAHMMGGMLIIPATQDVLYNYWLIPNILKYDQLIHAYGFGIATWACWLCLRAIQPEVQATTGPLFLVLLAGIGLGGINETVEFFATLILPETNVGDYTNIGWDLVFNLLGGLLAIFTIRLMESLPSLESHVSRSGTPRSKLL